MWRSYVYRGKPRKGTYMRYGVRYYEGTDKIFRKSTYNIETPVVNLYFRYIRRFFYNPVYFWLQPVWLDLRKSELGRFVRFSIYFTKKTITESVPYNLVKSAIAYTKNALKALWLYITTPIIRWWWICWNAFYSTRIGFFLADRYIFPIIDIIRLLWVCFVDYEYEFGYVELVIVYAIWIYSGYLFLVYAYFATIFEWNFDWDVEIGFIEEAMEVEEDEVDLNTLINWYDYYHNYVIMGIAWWIYPSYGCLHATFWRKRRTRTYVPGYISEWRLPAANIEKWLATSRIYGVSHLNRLYNYTTGWLSWGHNRFKNLPIINIFYQPHWKARYVKIPYLGKYFEDRPWVFGSKYPDPDFYGVLGRRRSRWLTRQYRNFALNTYQVKSSYDDQIEHNYQLSRYCNLSFRLRRMPWKRLLYPRRRIGLGRPIRWLYKDKKFFRKWKYSIQGYGLLKDTLQPREPFGYEKYWHTLRTGMVTNTYYYVMNEVRCGQEDMVVNAKSTPHFTLFFYRLMRWFLMIGPHG